MAEYIERSKLMDHIELNAREHEESYDAWQILGDVEDFPAADVVSRAAFNQVMWERDTAMEQLKAHGIPFGGKADVVAVVRCKECKYYGDTACGDMCKRWEDWLPVEDDDFCSYGERRADDATD